MIDFQNARGRGAKALSSRVTVLDDPQVDADARALVVELTEPHMAPLTAGPGRNFVYRLRTESNRSCPLTQTVRLATLLRRAGAPIASILRIRAWLDSQFALVAATAPIADAADIDRREGRLQAHEDWRALIRWQRGAHLSPAELRDEAAACEGKAAVLQERALWCRHRARELEWAASERPAGQPHGGRVA